MSGTWLGIIGGAVAGGAWALWMWRMQQVRIPSNRVPFHLAFALSVFLGVAAFVKGAGTAGGVGAGVAILGGGLFLGLRLQSSQDARAPAVSVGGPILDFAAPDDGGESFELASLRGKPFLLKFFRGHW